MVLATAEPTGRVSARCVLLKGYDERGLKWYTNYDSDKVSRVAGSGCERAGRLIFVDAVAARGRQSCSKK
jgi:pyridoxine/pyridoxamine 5'-phosphate oxidase